ncbi:MAG: hemerythrin domain-containing protein [Pirellulaceae bacterium]|nr:hemerythrin domain-containing protein [Pirellulaceae bacterium]
MRDFPECQAFVDHLRSEHKQIRQAVVDVEHELRAACPSCETDRLREKLQKLSDTLAEHFKEEEQGGCLEEAVSCVPHLSPLVTQIEKAHVSILRLIHRLVERADDCHTVDFIESFRCFAEVLHAHEVTEDQVLHTAFGTGEFETDELPPADGEQR